MNILICTIVRDRANKLDQWINQLKEVVEDNKNHSFDLSLYENDSIDGTKEWIKNTFAQGSCGEYFNKIWIKTENLGTKKFGSIANEERVKLLADARNKCMEKVDMRKYDYVMFVESDVQYNPKEIKILLDDCENWDILSGASFPENKKFWGDRLYDTWATRHHEDDNTWKHCGSERKICNEKGILEVWSTFNCFCIYRAEAFKKCQFGWYSEKTKKFDCDTTVICEKFRANGYNKIAMNMKIEISAP